MRQPGHDRPPSPALRRALAARGLVPHGARWTRLTGGRTSLVFRARWAGRGGGNTADGVAGDLVVKLVPARSGSPLFPVDAALEARVMACLAPLGLSAAPRALERWGNAHCLIYRHAPGRPADTLSPGLARLLHRIHTLPRAATAPARLPRRGLLSPALLARGRAHLDGLGWDLSALEALARAERDRPPPARLVHGDPVCANVLVDCGHARLIDWQCAHLGDPVRDLAVATSPAMHLAYGRTPPDPATAAAFLDAYPCETTRDRARQLAPLLHLQMIGQCLWRQANARDAKTPDADTEDAALAAERAALGALL